MKIRPVGAGLFYADVRTDRHDKTNCLFSQFSERTYKSTCKSNEVSTKHAKSYFVRNSLLCSHRRGCDSVVTGQRYRTFQWSVNDDHKGLND
jgi:hypothetical protein